MKRDVLDNDSVSNMLEDFKRAYARLKNHKPHNVENIQLMQAGKLRINKSTLALEAGHSRTSYVNHTDILEFVEDKIGSRARVPRNVPSIEDANRTLREQNRKLQRALDDTHTQNAELISYIHFLEKEYKVLVRTSTSENPFVETITNRARKNPAAVRDMSKPVKLVKRGKNTV
jgi:hypothetical protein